MYNSCRISVLFLALLSISLLSGAATIKKGPYLSRVETDGVTVCWVTDVDEPSKVEYGTSRSLGQEEPWNLTDRKWDYVWEAGGPEELIAFVQVRLSGLEPDTEYFYRVHTGDQQSEISSFYTAVTEGKDFRFVAYGDTRPTDNHRLVVDRVMQTNPPPKFVLHTGDMVSNGQQWPDWQGFFDWEAPLLKKFPFYPSIGNHEHNAENYFTLFDLPERERWYSFDYGDAHFIALDETPQYRGDGGQRNWLIQDLRKNWDKAYTFVFFHHPPYSCTNDMGRRMGGVDLQQKLGPIFEAYEITAVFNGHDHNYQHNLVNGVHYVVTGGGGASIHPVRPRAFTKKAAAVYHIMTVDIDEDEATLTAVKADNGETVDRFTIPRRDTPDLEYE